MVIMAAVHTVFASALLLVPGQDRWSGTHLLVDSDNGVTVEVMQYK